MAESETNAPGAKTSIFKYIEAEYVESQLELQVLICGSQSQGMAGDAFAGKELRTCRLNFEAKAISIEYYCQARVLTS